MVPDHKDVLFVVHFDCRPAALRLTLSTRIAREAIIVMVIIYMQRSYEICPSGQHTEASGGLLPTGLVSPALCPPLAELHVLPQYPNS